MNCYLLKSEPEVYSFADLAKEHETLWDGVTNPVAVKHLREMKTGDKLVIYTREASGKRSELRR